MPVPPPEAGLVVRYNYLWRREADQGRDNSKARPACIVAAVVRRPSEASTVVLLPITHQPPTPDTPAIEIPARVKQHLGMDDGRSWVIVSEANVDTWPSPDLARIPDRGNAFAYGHLPPALFARIRSLFLETVRARRAAMVTREEGA